MGLPTEKSMNFGPSARRLLRRLMPERALVGCVFVLAIVSVVFSVIGPKILGHATNIVFDGVLGKRLPSNVTLQQAVDAARARGEGNYADVLSTSHAKPGHGIDFTSLGHTLGVVIALYVAASVFAWLQGFLLTGIVQRTVQRLRDDVEVKLNRLPLRYFDQQPRGELLSRVTNDIDNVAQSLQQTMSQLLTSLLTVVGVITMMFVISPLLAVIALVVVPVSVFITKFITKRSQRQFIAQWTHTGALNGQIEEARRLDTAALEMLEEVLGADHPRSIVCAINLASDHYALGDYQTALKRDRETLETAREKLGEEHPTTLACALNYSLDLRATGQEKEAQTCFDAAVEGMLKVQGPTHPATIAARQAVRADCDIYPIPV